MTENGEAKLRQAFESFFQTVAALRDPNTGCRWDLEQDFKSLKKYMIEEAYEAAFEMEEEPPKPEALAEELGDVLLQVFLNAQIASNKNLFSLVDVIEKIDEKMKRRHPHVFGSKEERAERDNLEAIYRRWSEIKKEEEKLKPSSDFRKGYFAKVAKPGKPPLAKAEAIGKRSSELGFDWNEPSEVLACLEKEVAELRTEITSKDNQKNDAAIKNELGDIYFTLAQVCRHLGLNAESMAEHGNQKFLKRFRSVEDLALTQEKKIGNMKPADIEKLWQAVKKKSE